MSLPLWGRWSWYHVGLLFLMVVVSAEISIAYLYDICPHRKKYVLLMSAAALPLSLLLEDVGWFLTRWQPIHYNEWT